MDEFSFKDVINGSENYWNEKGKNLESKENPKVYFLGGQSGAGKSKLKDRIGKENLVIDVDEFRKYHPNYFGLYRKYGKESAKYTHNFASAVADELVKKSIENKVDVIVDGTLKSIKTPKERAEEYKKNGYSLEINTVVVKPEKSFLGTLQRYEKMIADGFTPRMTPKEHHDLVVKNIPDNIEKIYSSKVFDEIKLYNRENRLLYSQKETPDKNPKEVLETEFKRKWDKEEFQEYKKDFQKVIVMMEKRHASNEEIENTKNEMDKIVGNVSKNLKKELKKNKEKDFER